MLSPNQTVRLQTEKGFDKQGIVTGFAQTPRSYTLYSQVIKCLDVIDAIYCQLLSHTNPHLKMCSTVSQNVTSSDQVTAQNKGTDKSVAKVVKTVKISEPVAEKMIVNLPTVSKMEQSVKSNVMRSGRISKPNQVLYLKYFQD